MEKQHLFRKLRDYALMDFFGGKYDDCLRSIYALDDDTIEQLIYPWPSKAAALSANHKQPRSKNGPYHDHQQLMGSTKSPSYCVLGASQQYMY